MASVYTYAATVTRIHDGDTLSVDICLASIGRTRADVDLGFNVYRDRRGIVLRGQAIRLNGCNAPELSTPEGKASLAFMESVLAVGDVVRVQSLGWDKYGGRVDGIVTLADGRDLARTMIAAGQAFAWDGKGIKPTA